jgi:hypothetical protein
MKKLTILIAILILFSCEKPREEPVIDPNKGTVTFWTTEDSGINSWHRGWLLWVDGTEIGVIAKPSDKIPVCGDMFFTKLFLIKGRHYYHMTLSIPIQPPPNYFVSTTYYFDVTARGCTVVRCTQ